MPAPGRASVAEGERQQLETEVTMNIDQLMENMTKVGGEMVAVVTLSLSPSPSQLSQGCPPGLWVASTDMILCHPDPISLSLSLLLEFGAIYYIPSEPLDMSEMRDSVCVLTVRATPQYAMKHGACKISESVSEVYPAPTHPRTNHNWGDCYYRERCPGYLTWDQRRWSSPGPSQTAPVTWCITNSRPLPTLSLC